jgi:hypothetical protein
MRNANIKSNLNFKIEIKIFFDKYNNNKDTKKESDSFIIIVSKIDLNTIFCIVNTKNVANKNINNKKIENKKIENRKIENKNINNVKREDKQSKENNTYKNV